ncbi:MAG TPA: methyltransferase domain-containing protein [Gemmatimonadaceae bacterium]|nr:methyltransferase domain-containing protein [Gemmatimonadaceae bacterium]
MSALPRVPPVPAVLRLVQTAVLGRWRATGEELYREVARITEAAPGRELLVSGAGGGITTEWLAVRTGAAVTGVDPLSRSVHVAEARARALPSSVHLHYQQASLDDLPHETAVFDAAIGEPALSAAADPSRAVAELLRVTKPMGPVVLLQPTWTSELDDRSRELLVERLGLRPHLLVEWKQMLRDAGAVDIHVQDWTTGAPGKRSSTPAVGVKLPTLTWREKMQITGRAFRKWGWREARGAVEKEAALLRELAHERSVGFALIKGVKWPHAKAN